MSPALAIVAFILLSFVRSWLFILAQSLPCGVFGSRAGFGPLGPLVGGNAIGGSMRSTATRQKERDLPGRLLLCIFPTRSGLPSFSSSFCGAPGGITSGGLPPCWTGGLFPRLYIAVLSAPLWSSLSSSQLTMLRWLDLSE